MRVFTSTPPGGIDSLQLIDAPKPGPLHPGQIRVRMHAASLNYRDLLMLNGAFSQQTYSLIPVCDGAGEVIEIAPDVKRVKAGDRIALTCVLNWIGGDMEPWTGAVSRGGPLPGVMQDELVVNQLEAVKLPEHLSYEDGASLPCAAVTAWHALCRHGPLLPGMNVLLQGAGGVSVFALQFAKAFGTRVIMTSSSPERCARLKALGADDVIDYNANPDWQAEVRKLTGGVGADHTIDVGGAKTIDKSIAATRYGGTLALIGLLSGLPNITASMFLTGVKIVYGAVGSRDDFEAMNRAIAYHKIKPVIDSSFKFEQLPEALRLLESGKQFGKIVLKF